MTEQKTIYCPVCRAEGLTDQITKNFHTCHNCAAMWEVYRDGRPAEKRVKDLIKLLEAEGEITPQKIATQDTIPGG